MRLRNGTAALRLCLVCCFAALLAALGCTGVLPVVEEQIKTIYKKLDKIESDGK